MSTGKPLHKRISTWLVALITAIALALPLSGGIAQAADPVIPDKALADAVKIRLWADGKDPFKGLTEKEDVLAVELTQEMVGELTNLTASRKGIKSLEGLQHATKLVSLNVPYNEIADLSPVENLTELDNIVVHKNPITSLKPLSKLTKLTIVGISSIDVSTLEGGLEPLTALPNLQTFNAVASNLTNEDVVQIGKIKSLKSVSLGENSITDFSPLGATAVTSISAPTQKVDAGAFPGGTESDKVVLPPFIDKDGNNIYAQDGVEFGGCSKVLYSKVAAEGENYVATVTPASAGVNAVGEKLCVSYPRLKVNSFLYSVKISATFYNELTVTFKPENGADDFDVKVPQGSPVAKPEDPVKEGYVFQGWYFGDSKWDFTTPVKSDMTLTAKWEKAEEPEQPGTVVPTTPGGDNGGSGDPVKPGTDKPAPSVPGTPGKPGKPGKLPGTGV